MAAAQTALLRLKPIPKIRTPPIRSTFYVIRWNIEGLIETYLNRGTTKNQRKQKEYTTAATISASILERLSAVLPPSDVKDSERERKHLVGEKCR
jgi:hypothetical protein